MKIKKFINKNSTKLIIVGMVLLLFSVIGTIIVEGFENSGNTDPFSWVFLFSIAQAT